MSIRLKVAHQDDLEILMPLICDYHRLEGINLSADRRLNAVKQILDDHRLGYIWLIHHSQIAIGYIALCTGYSIEFGGFDAFIDEFYIDSAFRRQGIGTNALQLVKEQSAALGINAIHLEVAKTNHKAQALYHKLGFQNRDKYTLMSFQVAKKH